MRPSQVSRFMKWRDEQPRYREALREVLALSEAAEGAAPEEGLALEARWKEARERLLAIERELLAEWELARG
jgi:hypothetical protein